MIRVRKDWGVAVQGLGLGLQDVSMGCFGIGKP